MLAFYDIDENYINFLQSFDRQIPNISYESNNKFVCGVVLDIDGIQYYAPISHFQNKQQTNLQITNNKGRVLSTIRFSFMFPAPSSVLTKKNFSDVAKSDPNYAALLQEEYAFCSKHESEIKQKAMAVYSIGCNKSHVLNYTCCDFKLLEEHYLEYGQAAPNAQTS